jgi:hypothetical protein
MKFRKIKSPATKTIEFRLKDTLDKRVYKMPQPAHLHVPKWFEEMPEYIRPDTKPHLNPSNLTGKHCVPVLDGFTMGYQVTLPFELQISFPEKALPEHMLTDPNISLPTPTQTVVGGYPGYPITEIRPPEIADDFPAPAGYHSGTLVWKTWFEIITPPGYSVLITHPLNQYDLPFITASAVVDTDKGGGGSGAIPFYLKKDYTGFLTIGTPIMQIIPFKRESWKKEDSDIPEDFYAMAVSTTETSGFYKRNNWTPKKFN